VNLPETIHPIKCNAQQIEQVVLNIVRNAYQALLEGVLEGSGEKTIKVNAEFIVIDSQNHAQLTIANNGPNIPVDLIPKINEPFFTTKPPGTGTGLGLSISNDIMLDHGGTLEVRSEPCQYTEMILRLPVAPHPSVN
jgi:signal transduction histidine kinase